MSSDVAKRNETSNVGRGGGWFFRVRCVGGNSKATARHGDLCTVNERTIYGVEECGRMRITRFSPMRKVATEQIEGLQA